MRTLLASIGMLGILSTSPAFAKPPNPADFPLTVTVLSSETKASQEVLPNFMPTKTNTDCQINDTQATCQSTTPARPPTVIDVHTTYLKLELDGTAYTLACPPRQAGLGPGTYKAQWENGRRRLKILWNDGQKDRTVSGWVAEMGTPNAK